MAQEPATDTFAGTIAPEAPFVGFAPDAPMPPKVLLGTPGHRTPPIPVGPARPGPTSPPSRVIDGDAARGTGSFRFFQLETVRPGGINTSTTGEPSVAQTDHVVFQSGNWYASRSTDNGSSWSLVNPATFFGNPDGGFCCDQRLIYIPSHDITVWLLQYSYSAATGSGGYRIAVANGDADLANPNASAWTTYYISPQNRFGFGANVWFDFPDIAHSATGFFLSANVYDASSNYQGTTIIRTTLTALQTGASLPLSFINSISNNVGFAPRMATGGAGDRIWWASLQNTSTVQVGYYTETGSFDRDDRSIGTLSTTIAATPAPDSVNWARRAPTRFRGAYGNASEVGFLFTSGSTGAGRPNPFLRACRFTADTARTLISEHDIWSPSTAWTYGAAATNRQGHVGIVAANGSSTAFVHNSATIIDNYQPWGGLSFVSMGAGQDSPNQNRWGDYFDVRQHDNFTDTFVGTGMRQIGGSGAGSNNPQYAWFGRNDYEPTWVNLTVQSTPFSGVPITLQETDMSGLKNGSTSMSRRFTPLQPYTLTAPATRTSGGIVYSFIRWRYRVSPTGLFINAPLGDRELSLSTIGNLDDTAIAEYGVEAVCDTVGEGCGGSPAQVYEQFPTGLFDLESPRRDVVYSLSTSGVTTSSTSATAIVAPVSADLGLADDENTAPIPLGFTMAGLCATSISVSSNGYLWLGGEGRADFSESAFELANEGARLAVYWTDLNPAAGGTVHVDVNPGVVYVTWQGVWAFNGTAAEVTAQARITANSIRLRYNPAGGAFATSVLVGLSNGVRRPAPPGVNLSNSSSGTVGWAPDLRVTCEALPLTGSTARFRTSGVPAGGLGLASIALGSATVPGVPLAPLTPVGCEQYVQPGYVSLGLILGSCTGVNSLAIPNSSTFLDLSFTIQSWALAANITTSNGLNCVVGSF